MKSTGAGIRKNYIEEITPLDIKAILHRLGIGYRELAVRIGYKESTVYGWISGSNVISKKAQEKIQEISKGS